MTQPIDPTQWPKVESRHVSEDGIYWVNSSGRWLALRYAKGEGATPNPLYGPITFATEKTMPQVIDLSHFDLSKIEPKKQTDKPGVWHLSKSTNGFPDVNIFVSQELFDHPSDWDDGEYRYLCDFIPPKQSPVIPPKPEKVLHLMRLKNIISPLDGNVGDIRWCTKRSDGNYRTLLESGAESGTWWANCQCEPVTE